MDAPNPYAPPKADLNGELRANDKTVPDYFLISPALILILSALSLGIFQVYWAYRQWLAAKKGGERVNPVGRALFLVIFTHTLFRGIQFARNQSGLPRGRAQDGTATMFVVLAILSNLAGRSATPFAFLFSSLLTVGSSFALFLAQADINELAQKTGANTNRGIGIGGILLVLLGMALLLPSTVALLQQ